MRVRILNATIVALYFCGSRMFCCKSEVYSRKVASGGEPASGTAVGESSFSRARHCVKTGIKLRFILSVINNVNSDESAVSTLYFGCSLTNIVLMYESHPVEYFDSSSTVTWSNDRKHASICFRKLASMIAPMPSRARAESRHERHCTQGLFALRIERSKTNDASNLSPNTSDTDPIHSNDDDRLVEIEDESSRWESGFDSNVSRTDTTLTA